MRINLSTRQWAATILGILFVLYVLFQARFLILGPRVYIDSPSDAHEATSPLITISGRGKNVAWIELNGRQIFTDENGFWSEKLLLSPGTSIMTVWAKDRFGREDTAQIRVILIHNNQTPLPQDDQEQESQSEGEQGRE